MSRMVRGSDAMRDYLREFGARESPALRRCREETAALPNAMMQISPEQGAILALLVRLMDVRRYLEIGTFTGYSALAVAEAMPDDGRVVALDVSREYTDRAKGYWRAADVDTKIDLRIGPAIETLDAMLAAGEPAFDFAFVDADKPNYDGYYERALGLLRPGGLLAVDNMFWGGSVADLEDKREVPETLRALTRKIYDDGRVDMALASIGDGVMLIRKR